MNNDRISLIATVILTVLFLVSGILDILNLLVIRIVIFALFLAIIINILVIKSKDEDKKNLPE